jgi:ribosome-associated protein
MIKPRTKRPHKPRPAPDEAAQLALTLGRLALERKAEKLVLLDLRRLSSFTDFMLILSGRSSRQVQALGEHLLTEAAKLKLTLLGAEGLTQAHWVLLDFGMVVVHVFLDEVRGYYDLEGLWSDAAAYDWDEAGPEPDLAGPARRGR